MSNGGTELNQTSSLYDLDFRNYDPILGRMSQVDPMAHKYSSLTSYNFSFNNPVNHNDPNGADPHQTVFDYIQAQWQSNTIVPLLPALSLEADGIGTGGANGRSLSGPAATEALINYLDLHDAWGQNGVPGRDDALAMLDKLGLYSRNARGELGYWDERNSYTVGKEVVVNSVFVKYDFKIANYSDFKGTGDSQGWWDKVKDWFSEDGKDSPKYKAYMADRAANPEFYEKGNNVGTALGMLLPGGGLLGSPKSVSVIGPRATYREFAKSIGAFFLNISDDAWTWEKNLKFLNGVINRGDDVIFAGKFNPARLDPTSTLAREINYLIESGYKWADDFSRLIKY